MALEHGLLHLRSQAENVWGQFNTCWLETIWPQKEQCCYCSHSVKHSLKEQKKNCLKWGSGLCSWKAKCVLVTTPLTAAHPHHQEQLARFGQLCCQNLSVSSLWPNSQGSWVDWFPKALLQWGCVASLQRHYTGRCWEEGDSATFSSQDIYTWFREAVWGWKKNQEYSHTAGALLLRLSMTKCGWEGAVAIVCTDSARVWLSLDHYRQRAWSCLIPYILIWRLTEMSGGRTNQLRHVLLFYVGTKF